MQQWFCVGLYIYNTIQTQAVIKDDFLIKLHFLSMYSVWEWLPEFAEPVVFFCGTNSNFQFILQSEMLIEQLWQE